MSRKNRRLPVTFSEEDFLFLEAQSLQSGASMAEITRRAVKELRVRQMAIITFPEPTAKKAR